MKDRVSANPGRVLITPEDGSGAFYATLAMADSPTVVGTPLNAANLLSQATAALFGLGADAVPDDVLARCVSVETGSYIGTGTYGAGSPNTINTNGNPIFAIVNRHNYGLQIGDSRWNNSFLAAKNAQSVVINSSYPSASGSANIYFNENSISWSTDAVGTNAAYAQLNGEGIQYDYFILCGGA